MYEEEAQDNEERELNQLAEIHLQTPEGEVERALVSTGSLYEDEDKEESKMIMDATPVVCPGLNKVYEALKRKEDEDLPPSTLKPLPKGLRYEFVDNTESFPIIVNADLSGKEKE